MEGGGLVMDTYGYELFSKTINVIELIDLYCSFFALKSVKYKFLDFHRLKLIRFMSPPRFTKTLTTNPPLLPTAELCLLERLT